MEKPNFGIGIKELEYNKFAFGISIVYIRSRYRQIYLTLCIGEYEIAIGRFCGREKNK